MSDSQPQSSYGACAGCGKTGELVMGVCRHSRRSDAEPKKSCFNRAASADRAVVPLYEEWLKNRPRTPTEQVVLGRMWPLKKGCFKKVADLGLGQKKKDEPADPHEPKLSDRTTRRALRSLRMREDIFFAGQHERGMNWWLLKGCTYSAKEVQISKHRSVHHLWSTEKAQALIVDGMLEKPESLIIHGYNVNRKTASDWQHSLIIEAIGIIKTWYPDPKRIKWPTSLLESVMRRILEGRGFISRVSDEHKRRDEKRFQQVAADISLQSARRDAPEQELAILNLLKMRNPALASQIESGHDVVPPSQGGPTSDESARREQSKTPSQRPQPQPKEEKGTPVPASPKSSVRWQIEQFLKGKRIGNSETFEYYTYKCKALLENFPDISVEDITTDHIVEYCQLRREQNIKDATIRPELNVLYKVAKLRSDEFIQLRRQIRKDTTREPRWLEPDEFKAIRQKFPPHRQDFLDVAVHTGCRLGELESLTMEHFDLKKSRLLIPGTKTKKSKRWVPVHPEVMRVVHASIARGKNSGPLLEPWDRWECWRQLGKVCGELGIKRFSVVDLRHTFISWLVQAGKTAQQIKELTGHTDSAMIDRVYGHFNDSSLRSVLDGLPDARGGPLRHFSDSVHPD